MYNLTYKNLIRTQQTRALPTRTPDLVIPAEGFYNEIIIYMEEQILVFGNNAAYGYYFNISLDTDLDTGFISMYRSKHNLDKLNSFISNYHLEKALE